MAEYEDIDSKEIPSTGAAKTLGMRVPLEQYNKLLKQSIETRVPISDILYYKVFLEDKKTAEYKKLIENNVKEIAKLNAEIAALKSDSNPIVSKLKKNIEQYHKNEAIFKKNQKTLELRLENANKYIKENVFGYKLF